MYPKERLPFFPFAKFQNSHSWHQATGHLGLVFSEVIAYGLLSEMKNVTRGKECWIQSIIHTESESN